MFFKYIFKLIYTISIFLYFVSSSFIIFFPCNFIQTRHLHFPSLRPTNKFLKPVEKKGILSLHIYLNVLCRSPQQSNQDPSQETPTRKISLLSRPFGLGWRERNKVSVPRICVSGVSGVSGVSSLLNNTVCVCAVLTILSEKNRMQQGKPTSVEEPNDGKSSNEGQSLSLEQEETDGHKVEEKV